MGPAMVSLTLTLTLTLTQVREAVVGPAMVSSLVQLTNGPIFAGEGILMGVGGFGFLAGLTSIGVAVMVIATRSPPDPVPTRLDARLPLQREAVLPERHDGTPHQVGCLTLSSTLGLGVSSVWFSLLAFHIVQLAGVMLHHLRLGPLAHRQQRLDSEPTTPVRSGTPPGGVECVDLPLTGEVCISAEDAAESEAS